MSRVGIGLLAATLALAGVASLAVGEVALSSSQWLQALRDPSSAPGEIVFAIRAPRAAAALLVGGALGLAGAVLQGLLRNPLADPGVLGVSACAALAAAIPIALGLGAAPFAIEGAALIGALAAGGVTALAAAKLREPQTLILAGVALSSAAGALTALVFNLARSPVAASEILGWMLGSVANRDWNDIALAIVPSVIGAGLCAYAGRGLRMLTLGDEAAALSGLPMARLRGAAVAGAALLTGAAVAIAGVIGFVGLAAPHLVRPIVGADPRRLLIPSAAAGGAILLLADLLARTIPTEQELKLGVVTALVGAPVFAALAWRAGRAWRS